MIHPSDKNIYAPYIKLVQDSIKFWSDGNNWRPILLDAGCGHSTVLEEEYKFCEKVIGVDLDKEGLEKNELVHEKIYADLTSMPLEDSGVDIIVSAWVLEHIEDPGGFAQELARLLSRGGEFIFITPNKNSVYALLSRIIPHRFHDLIAQKLYKRGAGDTFRAFYLLNSEADLDRLLLPLGFEKIEFIYNDDPKYLGFSRFTKFFAKIWHKIIMLSYFEKFRVHIVGRYQYVGRDR